MKKSLLFVFLLSFVAFAGVNGQNLVVNPDFENWDDANTPTGWEKAEDVTQESTIVHAGTYSAMHVGGTKDLAQTFDVESGKSYMFSIWYYVVPGDGTDARLWCVLQDETGTADYDNTPGAIRGPDGGYLDNGNDGAGEVWMNFTTTVTIPDGLSKVYFELRTYSGATVYWDDLSVEEYTPSGSLELTTPNGGETYSAGETVQLAWNSTDVSNVYFEVLDEDGTWEQISDEIASVDGANTYDFTIPANAWSWDGYKLKVVDASASSINDESDATFIINGHDTELLWEDFSSGTINNFAVASSGTVAWEIDNYGDDYYAKASGYNAGANETWLISPSIDLDNTTDEILEFITASNYSGPDMVVKYSTDYDGLGDPSTATWTEFSSYVLSAGNWEWISSGYIDMSSINGTVNIAFIYTSTESEAKTWEVTDIELTGVGSSTGVNKTKENAVKIIPNPFTTEFRIDGDAVSVTLYNAAGQLVKNVPAVSGVVSTSDLSKGMYILQVKLADGSVTTQKVIKK
ncbi:T9SS-dependent choice-of-anchor J family protein [Carboxylicivirga linearis]|uniref:T9SS type A sorting domain-containing protein n=1 Tax=Carboxylicivirga linearis TaxID=1628157 RepID=A0ABS5JTT1_9BACT|nr:T9SS type A sorting domain-containing protein [Carboxylicivirga linearis]MBS2097929.1 T9SS type A sorting domain-containing protein [Carboxylicivirga linearis]